MPKDVLGQGHYTLGCVHCNCVPGGSSSLVLLFSVLLFCSQSLFALAFIDATMASAR